MTRPPLDLSVYLVTDTPMCAPLGVVETVRRAVAGGVTVVQLRDHDATDEEFVALGRELVAALAGTGVPLLVDDRVHLVAAIGAQGAHVGQHDLPVDRARALLGDDALLGLSIETPAQLDLALAHGAKLDYLGVGPVRATATKPGHAIPLGLAVLADVAARSPWPTCAIGGVTAADADAVRAAGFDGLCVVSAVCGRPDPQAAARALADAWAAAAGADPARTTEEVSR